MERARRATPPAGAGHVEARRRQCAWDGTPKRQNLTEHPRDLRSKYMYAVHTYTHFNLARGCTCMCPRALPGRGTPGACRRRRRPVVVSFAERKRRKGKACALLISCVRALQRNGNAARRDIWRARWVAISWQIGRPLQLQPVAVGGGRRPLTGQAYVMAAMRHDHVRVR